MPAQTRVLSRIARPRKGAGRSAQTSGSDSAQALVPPPSGIRFLDNLRDSRVMSPAARSGSSGPLAVTREGGTVLSRAAVTHGKLGEILAHEAVHRAQFKAWGERPVGTLAQLEGEAISATPDVVACRDFSPRFSARPGDVLTYQATPPAEIVSVAHAEPKPTGGLSGIFEVSRADGRWLVYVDRLRQMIRHYTASEVLVTRSEHLRRVKSEGDSIWSAALGWFVPDVVEADIDWNDVNRLVSERTTHRLQAVLVSQHTPMEQTKRELAASVLAGRKDRKTYDDRILALQKRNHSAVADAVSGWSSAIGVARFMRDASIDILTGALVVYTGGTGVALLGISAGAGVAKGGATFQDTGELGAAVVSGTMGAMTTLLKIPASKMARGTEKAATEVVIVAFEASGDFMTNLMAGSSMSAAFNSAVVSIVSSVGAGVLASKTGLDSKLAGVVANDGLRTRLPGARLQTYGAELAPSAVGKLVGGGIESGIDALGAFGQTDGASDRTEDGGSAGAALDYVIQRLG